MSEHQEAGVAEIALGDYVIKIKRDHHEQEQHPYKVVALYKNGNLRATRKPGVSYHGPVECFVKVPTCERGGHAAGANLGHCRQCNATGRPVWMKDPGRWL